MHGKVIGALALLVVLIAGCARHETAKTLAQRLSKADRVIVLNPTDGVTMTITDDLFKRLIRGIEGSQKLAAAPDVTTGHTLVFFYAGVHVATVPTGGEVFYIDKTPYADKSGTLKVILERFWEKHPPGRPR